MGEATNRASVRSSSSFARSWAIAASFAVRSISTSACSVRRTSMRLSPRKRSRATISAAQMGQRFASSVAHLRMQSQQKACRHVLGLPSLPAARCASSVSQWQMAQLRVSSASGPGGSGHAQPHRGARRPCTKSLLQCHVGRGKTAPLRSRSRHGFSPFCFLGNGRLTCPSHYSCIAILPFKSVTAKCHDNTPPPPGTP